MQATGAGTRASHLTPQGQMTWNVHTSAYIWLHLPSGGAAMHTVLLVLWF
jgi:hypothetical protein